MSEQWLPHVTVAAIVENSGRFLMVEEFSGAALVLNQPAGHLERNESLLQAVERETLEETGWRIRPTALIGVYRWPNADSGVTYLRFAFASDPIEQVSPGPIDAKIQAAVWLTPAEIAAQPDRLRSPQVLATLADYRGGRRIGLDVLRDLC